jgi:hypothetical protein
MVAPSNQFPSVNPIGIRQVSLHFMKKYFHHENTKS